MTHAGNPVVNEYRLRKMIDGVWYTTLKYRNAGTIEKGQRGLDTEDHYFVVWFELDGAEVTGLWKADECETYSRSGGCVFCGWRGRGLEYDEKLSYSYHTACLKAGLKEKNNLMATNLVNSLGYGEQKLFFVWDRGSKKFLNRDFRPTNKPTDAFGFDSVVSANIEMAREHYTNYNVVDLLDAFKLLTNTQLPPESEVDHKIAARAALRMLQSHSGFKSPTDILKRLHDLINALTDLRDVYREMVPLQRITEVVREEPA